MLLPVEVLWQRIAAGKRLLCEGAMGSELIRAGIAPEATRRANITHPELVKSIHRAYLEAGAQIICTNTFGTLDNSEEKTHFRAGMELGFQVVQESYSEAFLWLSLHPNGVINRRKMLEELASEPTFPKAILLETCTNLMQALEAVSFLHSLEPQLLAVTCHFDSRGTMLDGTTPEEAARTLLEAGVAIVGGNCGEIPEAFISVVQRMRSVTTVPLLFQPSAGLPTQTPSGSWQYSVSATEFSEVVEKIVFAGATIVGGCCGTTPDHIRALRQRLI